MGERAAAQARAAQATTDEYIRSVAGEGSSATAEIERAKALLDSGTINQAEFETLKASALARR